MITIYNMIKCNSNTSKELLMFHAGPDLRLEEIRFRLKRRKEFFTLRQGRPYHAIEEAARQLGSEAARQQNDSGKPHLMNGHSRY